MNTLSIHTLNSLISLPLQEKCAPITYAPNVLVQSHASTLAHFMRIYPKCDIIKCGNKDFWMCTTLDKKEVTIQSLIALTILMEINFIQIKNYHGWSHRMHGEVACAWWFVTTYFPNFILHSWKLEHSQSSCTVSLKAERGGKTWIAVHASIFKLHLEVETWFWKVF
jgi:hypothetical protein